MNKLNNLLFAVALFSFGYMANDIIRENDLNFVKRAEAGVDYNTLNYQRISMNLRASAVMTVLGEDELFENYVAKAVQKRCFLDSSGLSGLSLGCNIDFY